MRYGGNVELEREVRGVKVVVHANNFTEDPSVGIRLGPDEVYAKTEDGKDFELTEEEEIRFSTEATDSFLDWEGEQ